MDPVLDWFDEYYEPAKRHQDAMANEWSEYESAYYGEPEGDKPAGDDAWRSWIFYKYAFQQIKTLVAELASDEDPTFMWEPRTPAQEEYADVVDAIVCRQLQIDKYADKRLQAIEFAAIYGGCPIKVHWDYKEIERPRLTSQGITKDRFVVRDQPTMTIVDPRDFFYDVRARSMGDARYAFHRMRLSVDELRSRKRSDGKPLYKNLDQIEGQSSGATDSRQLDHDYSGERDRADRKGIEVIEMWTADRVIVRAGGTTIIRDDPNPYWHGRLPFEVVTLIPSLNDVWGLSVIWLLRDAQENIWTLDNAANDLLKMDLDPPRAVDSNDPENVNRLWGPGEVFPSLDAKTAVIPMQSNGVNPLVSAQAIDAQLQKLKGITGITDEVSGQSSADTATQAALNQRQSKGRIGVMLRCVDNSFARVAEMWLGLLQQYLDLSQPQKLLGDQGEKVWRHIAPSEIAGMWDVRAKNSSEKVVKELHRQNLMEALSAIMPAVEHATASGKTVDITPIIGALAESFNLDRNEVVVEADMMRQQHQKDVVADAQAQSWAQQLMTPPPEEGQPDPMAMVQQKLFESVNYKDLPDSAQAKMLENIGLPSDGVTSDNENATRPGSGKPHPVLQAALDQHAQDTKHAHEKNMAEMQHAHSLELQANAPQTSSGGDE